MLSGGQMRTKILHGFLREASVDLQVRYFQKKRLWLTDQTYSRFGKSKRVIFDNLKHHHKLISTNQSSLSRSYKSKYISSLLCLHIEQLNFYATGRQYNPRRLIGNQQSCQNLKHNMTELAEDINPLDISFSNQKGFEPSTPSQGSPSISDKQSISKVRMPREVFDPQQVKQTKKIVFVPKTYTSQTARAAAKGYQSLAKKDLKLQMSKLDMSTCYAKMYQTRYASTSHRRQQSRVLEPANFYRSTLYESELIKQKKRAQILRWDKVESNHLKQLSRLNNLINRVTTHMNAFNRGYPLKRK